MQNIQRISDFRAFSEKLLTEKEGKEARRHVKGIENILEKSPEQKKRLKVTEVFLFSELSKESQKIAIEDAIYINVDFDEWGDFIADSFKESLELRGYTDPKTLYSGFSSQGDGACFTTEHIDFRMLLKAAKLEKRFPIIAKNPENIIGKITHNYRYFFSKSTNVDIQQVDYEENDALSKEIEGITAFVEEDRERLGDEYYKELELEYDYLTSDEAVAETLEANEFEYTEDGKRF